jgi:phosphodiesterase/alkaline phosphatase D-like protein
MADLPPPPSTIARRQFLAGTAGTAGLLVAAAVPGAWAAPSRRLDDPFTLGVASGDPTPTGVVLWTRLAPRPWSRFFESRLRGYTRCTIRPDRWRTDLRVVDSITRRDAGVRTLARFVVEDGHPGAHRLH